MMDLSHRTVLASLAALPAAELIETEPPPPRLTPIEHPEIAAIMADFHARLRDFGQSLALLAASAVYDHSPADELKVLAQRQIGELADSLPELQGLAPCLLPEAAVTANYWFQSQLSAMACNATFICNTPPLSARAHREAMIYTANTGVALGKALFFRFSEIAPQRGPDAYARLQRIWQDRLAYWISGTFTPPLRAWYDPLDRLRHE